MKSEDDELPLGELYECRPPEACLGDDVDGVPSSVAILAQAILAQDYRNEIKVFLPSRKKP